MVLVILIPPVRYILLKQLPYGTNLCNNDYCFCVYKYYRKFTMRTPFPSIASLVVGFPLLVSLWLTAITAHPQTITDSLTLDGPLARLFLANTTEDNFLDFLWGKSINFRHLSTDFVEAQTRMTIDANGNIGIGTPLPLATLDVNGTIRTNRIEMYNPGPHGNYIDFEPTEDFHLRALKPDYTWFATRVVIKPGGFVGINTLNPTVQLDVNGTIRADDIVQNKTLVVDLVFESYRTYLIALYSNKTYAEDVIIMDNTNVGYPERINSLTVTQNDINQIFTKMKKIKSIYFLKATSINTVPNFSTLRILGLHAQTIQVPLNIDTVPNNKDLLEFNTQKFNYNTLKLPFPCKLNYLSSSNNEDLTDISQVSSCTSLVRLDLQTSGTPSDLTDITPIYGLTGLEYLDLWRRTNLTCPSLEALTTALTTTTIRLPASCQ